MKVVVRPNVVSFSTLKAGQVFWIPDYGYFMKTETKGTCNAVNLETGELVECGINCNVSVADCELVIH